jgi:hypothetical protein
MICQWRNSNSSTLLACMGLQPIYADADVMSYANRAQAAGPGNWGYYYALSCLRINRLIRPNIPEGPCTNLKSVPSGAQTAFTIAGNLSTNDPEPISRAVIQGVGAVGSFFSALFSGAPSAQELQTQCKVVAAYNQFAGAVETALRNGSVSLSSATASLNAVHDQLTSMCQSVEGGTDSAPYGLRVALDALRLFNLEKIYPALVPALDPFSLFSNAPGGIGSGASLLSEGETLAAAPFKAIGFSLTGGQALLAGLALIMLILLVASKVQT